MAEGRQGSPRLLRGSSLVTGWGSGLQSLPDDMQAAHGRRLLPVAAPEHDAERLRRATRPCVLAVAVVEEALQAAQMTAQELAGPRTALLFASASAYAAANWAFVSGETAPGLYFPYTAPSAVPGEVTIQYAITGPYMTFLSGANAGLEALWQATVLLQTAQCDRVVVLAVETFAECAQLYTAGRWLLTPPLVEAAVCLILERHPGVHAVTYQAAQAAEASALHAAWPFGPSVATAYVYTPTARDDDVAADLLRQQWPQSTVVCLRQRLGNCLACTPLIGLLLALATGSQETLGLISRWGEAWSVLRWPGATSP